MRHWKQEGGYSHIAIDNRYRKGLRKLEATPGDQLKKNTAKVRPEIPHIRLSGDSGCAVLTLMRPIRLQLKGFGHNHNKNTYFKIKRIFHKGMSGQ